MSQVYIALGANLGDPVTTLQRLLEHLSVQPELSAIRCSSFYRSKPMGPQDQPDYVNAVFYAETDLAPLALLDYLQQLESQFGRVRGRRWGARTLDLDLLLYNDVTLQHERLQVPHPGLAERDFVVLPLAEIAPELRLPDGRPVSELRASMASHDLIKIT
ncbi:2-amino-4-hydroxy-6-hydroxymethyldihydropteridine diphosphokinase [Pseudidiomarina sp. 1APR75-33.1]|uniref:2-amino-4-hydroxy-6- hydroxymethyldihydropteridine diphosphokinase n=1 Tax=Pseudidiomarina terrestris TaxID=2820060 RepID=UPI0026555BDB|nr:2-amino-4-hydroxy-6-hydroxymethyldihydropteridine diphosphokinase [Pseudidiomarina sp. 1APR75-33.1]MDN7127331.1 2-amino-4-hydroxy-6-hydroxymethyldihydropteridine diphosphokinase [Pseudidiomarina sp. 1APR75-33.1]